MWKRNLDTFLIKGSFKSLVEFPSYTPLLNRFRLDSSLDDHRTITKLVQSEYFDRLNDFALEQLILLERLSYCTHSFDHLIYILLVGDTNVENHRRPFFGHIGHGVDLTILKNLSVDTKVNLERALVYGDAMGGHIVSGHVDQTGTVDSITEIGRDWKVTIECSKELASQIIHKGSITINGVSLTLTSVLENSFSVHLIPITRADTNLGLLAEGVHVNLELDILGKYAKRLLSKGEGYSADLSWDTFKNL